jgi:hypothetical protein
MPTPNLLQIRLIPPPLGHILSHPCRHACFLQTKIAKEGCRMVQLV